MRQFVNGIIACCALWKYAALSASDQCQNTQPPAANMRTLACCRPLPLRFESSCTRTVTTLACCVTCLVLLQGAAHALDPNKRITQYVHTAWRYSDHTAPDPMYALGQTSDGFLWFVSADLYRFDGFGFFNVVSQVEACHLKIQPMSSARS